MVLTRILLILASVCLSETLALPDPSFFTSWRTYTPDLFNPPEQTSKTEEIQTNVVEETPDEQLAFVFEVVRHGARAPITDDKLEEFPVSKGMLTPEGMRQRYLLGRYNRKRYIEDSGFLSAEYDPSEFNMQSTTVNRTMQSGYSELMGLYPPVEGGTEYLTNAQYASLVAGKSNPPFKVRYVKKINVHLGLNALPYDPVAVPINVYNNEPIVDDTDSAGCFYYNDAGSKRVDDDSYYTQYDQIREDTREPLAASLGFLQDYVDSLDFHDFYHLADTDTTRDYQHTIDHADYFTDQEWFEALQLQRDFLTDDFDKDARDLMASRMLRKPLKVMQARIDYLTKAESETVSDGEEKESVLDQLKFMIYSSHDTQVDHMMVFLTKTMESFPFVPYASTVIFELKYSAKCLEQSPSPQCFSVTVAYNGTPLAFEGCSGDGDRCSWEEFQKYLESIWYSGPDADDLDLACDRPYIPQ